VSGILHHHPYPPFIPDGATRLIVGTLPPPRFSVGQLREGDVDFCYGSRDNLLWPALDTIFRLGLRYDGSREAVAQREDFLRRARIGICDIVESCRREKTDASDLGMEEIVLRDLLGRLHRHPAVDTLIFTGGNTRNGPEYLFRRQLRAHGLQLVGANAGSLRRQYFHLGERTIRALSLLSPSKAANRAIGGNPAYKLRRASDLSFTPFDFRIEQYRQVFLS
jgi:G:T/U-mismatch repair DNA glycosylase